MKLQLGADELDIGSAPILMGIVNVTPDSFSDGGQFLGAEAAIRQARCLADEGADWIDIGGESTRPGAEPVPVEEELARVTPVLERLAGSISVPISIDTYKAEVAARALSLGARILNDVTGFRDERMVEVAAGSSATLIVMHMKGDPETMHDHARYDDLVGELIDYFGGRIDRLVRAGIRRERIVLDPGIGFAKRRSHNLAILQRLDELLVFGRPLLLGISRKRIVGEVTGQTESGRLAGSLAAAVVGYGKGARIFRVHDVAATRDALRVAEAIATAPPVPRD